MSAQVVRFRELTPTPLYTPDPEVPDEVYRSILPPIYLMMGPEPFAGGAGGNKAMIGPKELFIGIIAAAPGIKIPLHAHLGSTEIFLCLTGRFRLRSRDAHGASEAVLEPFDMASVPAGTYRDFVNVTGEPALILAMSLIHDAAADDVLIDAEESRALCERLGPELLKRVGISTGNQFQLGPEPEGTQVTSARTDPSC
jgi:quercetin dioxygenase-like cupin family protein